LTGGFCVSAPPDILKKELIELNAEAALFARDAVPGGSSATSGPVPSFENNGQIVEYQSGGFKMLYMGRVIGKRIAP
jgi:hypothetical protein